MEISFGVSIKDLLGEFQKMYETAREDVKLDESCISNPKSEISDWTGSSDLDVPSCACHGQPDKSRRDPSTINYLWRADNTRRQDASKNRRRPLYISAVDPCRPCGGAELC